jgi:hypothetical protein
MTIQSPNSFQFSLKEIFAATAVVAVLLSLLPIAYGSERAGTAIYLLVGLIQGACSSAVYVQLRRDVVQRRDRPRRPYELGLLCSLFTLGTWGLVIVSVAESWLRTKLFPSFDAVMSLTSLCMVPHVPVFFLSVKSLMTMRDRSAHWPLATLFLLCLINTLFMFAAIFAFVGAHIPP